MNDNATMASFANNLWRSYIQPKIKQSDTENVTYYRAVVSSNNGDGTLTVQRAFDVAGYTISCTSGVQEAVDSGDSVLVLKYGNGLNALNHIAVAKADGDPLVGVNQIADMSALGTALGLGSLFGILDLTGITNANDLAGSGAAIITSASASSWSNLPEQVASWIIQIEVTTVYRMQFWCPTSNAAGNVKLLWRKHNASSWSAWQTIYS